MSRRLDPNRALSCQRLTNQQIANPRRSSPADLVRWLGAVQAQDYPGSLWALGLRLRGAGESDIEEAIAARSIVRTWPMRGTLHFVPAEDVRWMLRLLTPRVLARSAGRYRELGLAEADFARAERLLVRALRGGRRLTRRAAYAELERGGVSPAGQRGIHILAHLAQRGLLCFGPRQERQPTFVLLEEWVPAARDPARDEALAILAGRYFASHGPAALQDFAWWSGLLVGDARRGIEAAGPELVEAGGAGIWRSAAQARPMLPRRTIAALLPPWDEYLVAYKNRDVAVGHLSHHQENRLALVGRPLVAIDGRVCGSWRRSVAASIVQVSLDLWTPLSGAERRAVEQAVTRYGRFLGRDVEVRGLELAERPRE